jgi:amidase
LVSAVSQVPPFAAELTYPASIAGTAMADYLDWMRSCSLISVTGCPALSVPAAFTDEGLPVGLQIIGPSRADLAVLQVGHEVEAATTVGARRPAMSDPVAG